MLGNGPRAQTFGVMSTSSDSGEENENIREAVDPDFLINDKFRTKDESKDLVKPVSLRNVRNSSSSYNPLEIKATPEFRAHVSKFLRKRLDQVIDDTQELPENDRKKCRKKSKEGGVRLLRTSSNFMSVDSDQETPVLTVKKPKKVKRKQENDNSSSSCDSNEERAKEVAVTAEWILSGKATEGWAKSTKGKLEVITAPVSKSKCHGKK